MKDKQHFHKISIQIFILLIHYPTEGRHFYVYVIYVLIACVQLISDLTFIDLSLDVPDIYLNQSLDRTRPQ